MTLILVPGFWLAAESWRDVSHHLSTNLPEGRVDHTALTLPGLEHDARDVDAIRLIDHIAAVHAAIDAAGKDVVVVGHSGAGPICHAAASRAVGKVRRVVHIDTWPLGPGFSINAEMAGTGDVIGLPDWSDFEPEDLVDMTDPMRDRLRREARPQPAAIARDAFPEMDSNRFSIPTTIICCEFTSQQLGRWIESEPDRFGEVRRLMDVSYVDLPTGHWPQFTKPAELARLLAASS